LIALVLAVIVGNLTGTDAAIFGVTFYGIFAFVGSLFLNAMKMLIVSSIIVGIGSSGNLGRLGGKALLYYATSSLLAILIGLLMVNSLQPGVIDGVPAKDMIGLSEDVSSVTEKVEGKGAADIAEIFLRMVSTNIVAAADGQMLGLIFFSLLFGYLMTRVSHSHASTLHIFWEGVFEMMMAITDWIMKFAPIGVFALVAKVVVVASTGYSAFEPLAWFVLAALSALAFHFFITMPLLLRFIGRG